MRNAAECWLRIAPGIRGPRTSAAIVACSSIDHGGRYAYRNQPRIAHWNLVCLAQTLLPLLHEVPEQAGTLAQDSVDAFPDKFLDAHRQGIACKLGFRPEGEEDESLLQDLVSVMAETSVDFTLSFRRLADLANGNTGDEGVGAIFEFPQAFNCLLFMVFALFLLVAHVGNLAFEIGTPDLEHERSNGGEVSLRLNTGKVHGQASVFYYDINNFIFGAPTGEVVDGLLELEYEQGDSRFVGADLALSFHLDERWRLHVGGDVVDAKLEDTDEALARIPPLSGRLALDWLPVHGLQIRPELVVAAKQDDVFGTETATDGYTAINLMASHTIAGPTMMHVFTLKGTNLGDALYRNHMSLIKDLAPEMGRRVLLTYGLRLF